MELRPGLQPIGAASRKTHGSAGTFDIDLPARGPVGIECRSGGTALDYQIVVTFAAPVSVSAASITSGVGTIVSTALGGPGIEGTTGATQVTINLTGVTNAQRLTIGLFGVSDGARSGDVGVRLGFVLGDANGNGQVNSTDVGQAKMESGRTLMLSNFRTDVTANGMVNATDVGLVKAQCGFDLPPAPAEPHGEEE